MHSAGILSPKDPAFSVSVGLAALILEGRPHQNASNCCSNEDEEHNDSGISEALLVGEYTRSRLKDAAQRLNQKLQQIRTCPGTSKDYVESAIEVPVGSPSHNSDDYAEKFYLNPKFRNNEYPSGPYRAQPFLPYGKSNTRSLFKTLEAWTESNVIYTGLEKIKLQNMSPIKLTPLTKNVSSVRKKSNAGSTGPHCEQFLKKIGLVKVDQGDDTDHKCEYLSDLCRAWQLNLSKITSILAKNECICIEVFLGPENHAILLEQWTVKIVAKSSQPMMSLQSLCSAIRSQLYFSEIISWTEQLKNLSAPFSKEILDNPRILKNGTRAKLDILFRIRSFDGDSCFIEKPQLHQFPDATITDSICVQVCLKSAARINRIPQLYNETCTPQPVKSVVEERKINICTEKGKHRCVCDDEESPTKEECLQNSFPMPSAEHREKQLQKYKRRLMKREKNKKKLETMGTDSDSCCDTDHGSTSSNSIPCKSPTLNAIQTPLYNILPTSPLMINSKTTQTVITNANTVATQTEFCDVAMDCLSGLDCNICGNKIQAVCFNCDKQTEYNFLNLKNNVNAKRDEKSLEKADILLRALERTASINSRNEEKFGNEKPMSSDIIRNGSEPSTSYMSSPDNSSIDCRLCKRQKTNHTDHHALPIAASNTNNNNLETLPSNNATFYIENGQEENDDFSGSCSLIKPSNSVEECDTCNGYQEEKKQVPLEKNPRHKVNLLDIFDSEDPLDESMNSDSKAISSLENTFEFNRISPNSSTPVQKSSSAPTFNCASASLSPRFCRLAAAMYKRRSRHLSDRSSTSEEPLSDDELNYCESFGRTTLLKSLRNKTPRFHVFNLLGSLEESLLQHRIPPKHSVTGFKVLLGASGTFCPTQLTVPATSYFYELPGDAVTTPYVSEFKLPRKGYCVPITGTIQATLLNPLGTVVRMFVVPYDFSDMPAGSISFIRQRILARTDAGGTSCVDIREFNKLSRKDQMQLLRYAIHLRFKTSRSGRLYLHTDVKILILRRPDMDTAAAHANNSILESPNELNIITLVPEPRYSPRIDK